MAKSFSKRQYEQVVVSSLLSAQSQREEAQEETMTVDQWFIGLGKAAKAQYQNGFITYETFQSRLQELKSQYSELKNRAA